jgi:hypothetical protein
VVVTPTRGTVGEVTTDLRDVIDEAVWITDEELAAEALAADPDLVLDGDAVPFGGDAGANGLALLPAWYMPAAGRPRHARVAAIVVLVIVGSLLLAEAFGLCLTNGRIELPI